MPATSAGACGKPAGHAGPGRKKGRGLLTGQATVTCSSARIGVPSTGWTTLPGPFCAIHRRSAQNWLAGLGLEYMAMTAEPPQSPVTEGTRSLEVRWIFPGQLEAAVAGWFRRFPARTETREDTYLLDPQLRGLSVKVRGGGALEVKGVPRGPEGPGGGGPRPRPHGVLAEVVLSLQPAPPGQRRPGRLEAGTQEAVHQPVLTGQRADLGARRGAGRRAAVRGGTHRGPHARPGLVDPGIPDDRPRRSAPQRTPGHRRARVRRGGGFW